LSSILKNKTVYEMQLDGSVKNLEEAIRAAKEIISQKF
jgi:hypothetical protein